jgi:hypothetical protein
MRSHSRGEGTPDDLKKTFTIESQFYGPLYRAGKSMVSLETV